MTQCLVWVFRHGETDWNREGRFQGHLEVPLNENGRVQAQALIPKIKEYGIQAVLSSDLGRAQETAQIIAKSLSLPVYLDSRLREAHLGVAQGCTAQEIKRKVGKDLLDRWKSTLPTDADVSYPGGESGESVMKRVFEALDEFVKNQSFQSVGVATHGGVIRRIFQKLSPIGADPVPIPNGIIYGLHYDRQKSCWSIHSGPI